MANFTTSATLSELRAFCADNDIQVDGDRRRKQSYIEAIEAYQAECGDIEAIANEVDARRQHDEDLAVEIAIAEGLMTFEEVYPEGISQDAQEVLDALKAESEVNQTEVKEQVKFAPILLLFAQVAIAVVIAVVYLGIWGAISIAKIVKSCMGAKISTPDSYQQTKDLFPEDAWADREFEEVLDRLAIAN